MTTPTLRPVLDETWQSIVAEVFPPVTAPLSLAEIYSLVHRWYPEVVAAKPNWKAAVRRALRQHPSLERSGKGVWRLRWYRL